MLPWGAILFGFVAGFFIMGPLAAVIGASVLVLIKLFLAMCSWIDGDAGSSKPRYTVHGRRRR
jgi:hypothetical protein